MIQAGSRVAEATFAGTAVTRFSRPAAPAAAPALVIMSLGDRRSGGVSFGPGSLV